MGACELESGDVASAAIPIRKMTIGIAQTLPGRKADVSAAAWLRELHSYGLLRGSFRPDAAIATLRAYLRQRERLVEYAAAPIQHMQKALMEMNLQLHHVVTDITGATGMRIIRAIVAGERNPDVLAAYRDVRCHSPIETIRAARTCLCADPIAGTLRRLPSEDAGLRRQTRGPDRGTEQ